MFDVSLQVELSGAVEGKAVWPSHLKPVAWNNDGDMARMKLGLYHSIHNVADGEVEYKDISIEGPKGIIRTSPLPSDVDEVDEETCMVDPKTVRMILLEACELYISATNAKCGRRLMVVRTKYVGVSQDGR